MIFKMLYRTLKSIILSGKKFIIQKKMNYSGDKLGSMDSNKY
jgi:hypothetical protein